ncbi:MAG: ABC transporter ATP-binding protein [Clostridiales bacterium]|jgi:ABC-type lipoprotein export system ATPase subunit|nr:ABC transporter ATP-binding protein [Clostridiales bacterium]
MLLKLQNIGKIYDSNNILTIGVRNVSLQFDLNEFVIIEGESGAGKSTLLNIIGANDTYEEGELYFNGAETSHYSASEWERYRERNISTVFQDFNIIESLTVLENVELALFRIDDVKERKRVARELLAKVGLTAQTKQRGSELSGGEKQRTVIARALAKNSPIILADEPTGNLDVKNSEEIAKLLKDVSKDKLVVVVTHNAAFFTPYATRRVKLYDGKVSEDTTIEKPAPAAAGAGEREAPADKKRDLKNAARLGILNYKSRPRFTAMVSFALLICAVTLFIVLDVFGQSLIKPLKTTLDKVGIAGKVIVSNAGGTIAEGALNEISSAAGAGYTLADRELSEFEIAVPKTGGMLRAYTVTCVYAPYRYAPEASEAVLVMPVSASRDEAALKSVFLNAGVGVESVKTEKSLTADGVYLYLGYDALTDNGIKIRAINSAMRLGEDDATVYTFEIGEGLEAGQVNLINSNYWDVKNKAVVFGVNADKAYSVRDNNGTSDKTGGVVVQMNAEDYAAVFTAGARPVNQSCLYFPSDAEARAAIEKLPDGYIGMLSASKIYVSGAGDAFTANVLWYLAMIAGCICFAVLINVIFIRSIRIYNTDFAVYRTLGISRKISARSLYMQMALVFLPTLVLLPVVSLIAAVIPGSAMAFIGGGSYVFIELALLFIIEFVAFGFNKSIRGQSVRKVLRRGLK